MRIQNDGVALGRHCRLDGGKFRHIGDYTFTGTRNGKAVLIYTEPKGNNTLRVIYEKEIKTGH